MLINRTNVEDIFHLNSFVGSPQSTDLYFYKQCLPKNRCFPPFFAIFAASPSVTDYLGHRI